MSVRALQPILLFLTLSHQVVDLGVKLLNVVLSCLNGSSLFAALLTPSLDALLLLSTTIPLGVHLVTDLALLLDSIGLHDQLHAAGFAGAVLFGAVLAERTPFVVAALVDVLVEEAHSGST